MHSQKNLKGNIIKSEHWIFPKGAMGNLLFPCCEMCIIHFYPRKKVNFLNLSALCEDHYKGHMLNLATKLQSKNPETLSINVKKKFENQYFGRFLKFLDLYFPTNAYRSEVVRVGAYSQNT